MGTECRIARQTQALIKGGGVRKGGLDFCYVVNEKKMALQQMIDRKSSFFTSGEVNPCKASVIYHSIGYL